MVWVMRFEGPESVRQDLKVFASLIDLVFFSSFFQDCSAKEKEPVDINFTFCCKALNIDLFKLINQ